MEGRELARARLAIAGILALLAGSAVLGLVVDPIRPFGVLQTVLIGALAVGLLGHELIQRRASARNAVREASFRRILQGLSRSVSSRSVVDAIVDELRATTAADHVALARLLPAEGLLETTLVSATARTASSKTVLPAAVLEVTRTSTSEAAGAPDVRSGAPPRGRRGGWDAAAEEIARHVRSAYGVSYTLPAPLVADDRLAGALVLSRRTRGEWSDEDRALLEWAATEVSAALARAYAFEEAETRAKIDGLTGLPNRRYFDEVVSIVGPRRRAGDTIGVLMIDLDRFKLLNDRYGHTAGDRVLAVVARVISSAVRAADTPARYGGEEFAVILRQTTPAQALEVAERIRGAVRAIPAADLGIDAPISVSIGVAVGGGEMSVRSLIEAADAALYRAKRAGRDRVVVA